MQKKCAACGSERIIPLATIGNKTLDLHGLQATGAGDEPAIVIKVKPGAIFGGIVYGRIHARVCGECGYMPLFADNPQELYEAYQQFLRATQS